MASHQKNTMKKLLLMLFVCTITANLMAQKDKTGKVVSPTTTSDVAPPPPPLPPVPPAPPAPPEKTGEVKSVIVNDQGYEITVHYNNGNNMVYMKKNGVIEKISIEKWNEKKDYYENKYGILPPPPPPPPAPAAPIQ